MARESAAEKAAREEQEAAAAAVADAAADAEDFVDDSVDESNSRKVKVPASVGDEITFSRGSDVVASFKVTDGVVTARNDHERTLLLTNIDGAELVD